MNSLTGRPRALNPVPASDPAVHLGLYPADNFTISIGAHPDARLSSSARWYFRDQAIAVPKPTVPLAGFSPTQRTQEDLRTWSEAYGPGEGKGYPALVWLGAAIRVAGAHLAADGAALTFGNKRYEFATVPRFYLNRSYFDASSLRYFCERPLSLRGSLHGERFVARTLWPEDFRLGSVVPRRPVRANVRALRSLVRQSASAAAGFDAFAITKGKSPQAGLPPGATVVGMVLNGAQGDDDEAHGGHCALLTGKLDADGQLGQWLVCNFYTLDAVSEKATLPAILPLENYQGDLNSGQSWYRPSWLVFAVLRHERTALHLQQALSRVYNQFYRHQLIYDLATMNCAGITVDALRAVGWQLRRRGPTSNLLALAGLPWWVWRSRSLKKGLMMVEYLSEDRTRLFPAATFEEIGTDLLRLAAGTPRRVLTPFERMLAADIETVVFARLPQFPSSRAWGDFPVVSLREYNARMPKDPAQVKTVPVPPRPFPDALREPGLLPAPIRRSHVALVAWTAALLALPWIAGRHWRRRQRDQARRARERIAN